MMNKERTFNGKRLHKVTELQFMCEKPTPLGVGWIAL